MPFDYENSAPLVDRAERSPFKDLTRKTPDRVSNILILLVFVAGSGFLAWIFFTLMGVDHPGHSTGILGIAILIVAVVAAFASPHIIQTFEKATGWDVNGDGYAGPPPESVEVVIHLTKEGSSHHARIALKESLAMKLPLVCKRIQEGTPFSETGMTASKLLSKGEFGTLRDFFFAEGMCVWKDEQHHTLGVTFTGYGRSFLRQYAEKIYEISPTTTPTRTRTPVVPRLPAGAPVGEGEEQE